MSRPYKSASPPEPEQAFGFAIIRGHAYTQRGLYRKLTPRTLEYHGISGSVEEVMHSMLTGDLQSWRGRRPDGRPDASFVARHRFDPRFDTWDDNPAEIAGEEITRIRSFLLDLSASPSPDLGPPITDKESP